jgi:hypothetical protein
MRLYHRFHQRFGTAGLLVALIALVLALTTGAYAAGGGLSGKQKKEATKIAKTQAKSYANSNPGAQGPKGEPGAKGDPGADGQPGKSVGVTPIAAGGEACEGRAGAELKAEGAGSPTELCEGPPGPTETRLPPGKTIKGLWQFQVKQNSSEFGLLSVPFPLRVEPAPKFEYLAPKAASTEHCPGKVDEPAAEKGWLCLYTVTATGTKGNPFHASPDLKLGLAGTKWEIESTADLAFAYGTYAVTAECLKDEEGNEIPC